MSPLRGLQGEGRDFAHSVGSPYAVLCRPVPTSRDKSRLSLWEVPFYVGLHPTLIYVAPSRHVGINLGLQGEGRVFVHSVGFYPTLIYVAPSGLFVRGVSK